MVGCLKDGWSTAAPPNSEMHLFDNIERGVDLHTQVPHSAFDLGMS